MPYRLILEAADGSHRIYFFNVETQGQRGWAKLRLMRIEDYSPNSDTPRITEYNPDIHDGGSHHMSYLWSARGKQINGQIEYYLVGAFGDPTSRMMLEFIA
jgi:hypothetical protein